MINKNEYLEKLAEKLSPKLPTIETVCVLIFIAGLALKSSDIPFGEICLVLSLSALALVYFISGYKLLDNNVSAIKHFIFRLNYWGLSICTMGILFILNNYPQFNIMISVGSITLLIVLFFSLVKDHDLNRRMLARTVIILVLGLSLYFVPKEKLIKLKILHTVEDTNIH